MLAEINRLDGELEAALEEVGRGRAALETERQAHEHTRAAGREAQALAEERKGRIAELEAALKEERAGRRAQDEAMSALRVEIATLTERAAHVDELRALLKARQDPSV